MPPALRASPIEGSDKDRSSARGGFDMRSFLLVGCDLALAASITKLAHQLLLMGGLVT